MDDTGRRITGLSFLDESEKKKILDSSRNIRKSRVGRTEAYQKISPVNEIGKGTHCSDQQKPSE
jgi:hypothetical protein